MVENPQQLLQERLARINTTIAHQEPDRVPVCFGTETWIASYSGFTVQEMVYDYQKLIAVAEKVIVDFEWDAHWPPLGIWPAPVFDAVGQTQYLTAGTELDPGSTFQWQDRSPMKVEDYPAFIADPMRFIFEKMMPKRSVELGKP
jgi:hypothetical protein